MNIAVQFDENYLTYTGVMLTSLCINNKVHIELYVLNSALTSDDFAKLDNILKDYDITIHDLKVVEEDFDDRLPVSEDWTIETYFVLKLAELLPKEIERILFLDDDLIINGSIEELYNSELGNHDILAAPDGNGDNTLSILSEKQCLIFSQLHGPDYVYFNSGVMLMNIKQIRDSYSFSSYKDAMEKWNYELIAPDQDLLNYVHGGKVGYIDWKVYNLFAREAHRSGMSYEDVKESVKIIHFAGFKPWYSKTALHYDIEKLWWDYAKRTPCYVSLASDFIDMTLDNVGFETLVNNVLDENRNLHVLVDKCMKTLKELSEGND